MRDFISPTLIALLQNEIARKHLATRFTEVLFCWENWEENCAVKNHVENRIKISEFLFF